MWDKRLVKRIAKKIYKYRKENKHGGDDKTDYFEAERFLNMWKPEYEFRGEEFFIVWCKGKFGIK